ERGDRGVDPRRGELGQSLTLGLGGTEQEDLVHEPFRCKLERAFAITAVPGLDNGVDVPAEAEPAEELGVDGHRRIRDEDPLRRVGRVFLGRVNGAEPAGAEVALETAKRILVAYEIGSAHV